MIIISLFFIPEQENEIIEQNIITIKMYISQFFKVQMFKFYKKIA